MPTDPPSNVSSSSQSGTPPAKTRGRPRKISIKLDPQLTGSVSAGGAQSPIPNDPDPSKSLDEYRTARLEEEIKELRRQHEERKDLHGIRTRHAWLLFYLTVAWVVVVWLVILLQGFGQWFLPTPPPTNEHFYLKFKLSDTTIVAFMTSTTATVLGLYGIAAYWMYGNNRRQAEGNKKDKQGKSEANEKDGSAN
ncbi:hypothetical protein LQ564_12080 [Massilia sp. G4R7]|uniref:Uncharacterized protein n=1 Tax=Massilia phyllostachyos TaxID=2898585 RepID=A0ABS8Q5L7_9BURK|nr:hypothetical protein [Massilia phyllostachyos]MCD2517043.1 hypothetical protein [Massilia phyllostachyos]